MRINQLKAGSILSYVQILLNIVISLVYTPLMIRILGKSEYGLYNTVSSTIAMLGILNLGFSSSYIRFFTKYHSQGDAEGEASLNALYIIIFTVIGAIALACGLFLSQNLSLVFASGLTEGEYDIARTLTVLLTISIAINFPMSVFSSMIAAHEKFLFLKAVNCIKTVVSPLVMLPILLMGYGSIGMVVVTVVFSLASDALYCLFAIRRLKVRFRFGKIDTACFRDIVVYAGFIAINIIVDQINMNIDRILLGRYRGTVEVALYSVGYTLYTYFVSVSSAVSNVFTPRVHHIVERRDISAPERDQRLSALFIRVGRIQFMILGLVCTGLIFVGQPFIAVWSGMEEYRVSYFVALLLILPAIIPLSQNLGLEIQRAKNLHRFRSLVYALMAGLNLVLSIYLCQLYGAVGAAIGTAISYVLANGLIINVYYYKKVGIDIPSFWKNIGQVCRGLVIPALFGILFTRFVQVRGYGMVLAFALGYSFVYAASVWLLSMNAGEKKLVTDLARKITRKT